MEPEKGNFRTDNKFLDEFTRVETRKSLRVGRTTLESRPDPERERRECLSSKYVVHFGSEVRRSGGWLTQWTPFDELKRQGLKEWTLYWSGVR